MGPVVVGWLNGSVDEDVVVVVVVGWSCGLACARSLVWFGLVLAGATPKKTNREGSAQPRTIGFNETEDRDKDSSLEYLLSTRENVVEGHQFNMLCYAMHPARHQRHPSIGTNRWVSHNIYFSR